MNIGLIDVDNWNNLQNCFPNLALMKLSTYHRLGGDSVEWYNHDKHYDIVYMSKVFSFSKEPYRNINATGVLRGGTGYNIHLKNGVEVFDYINHFELPYDVEHSFPDYSLYGIHDTAYGFTSRGCPRNCEFCHVGCKEGLKSYKVADLSEFWNGQKYIELLDPNTFACKDWKDIVQQLIDSGAAVNFNQGVDIRIMTPEKIEMLMKVKTKHIHFAWDRYQDKDIILKQFKMFKELTNWGRSKVTVYILTNFDTSIEQDIERVMYCRDFDFCPYIMRYDKEHIKKGSEINKLARWVNNKRIFWSCNSFEQYKTDLKNGMWR